VAKTRPSSESVTVVAPLVVQLSSICVGALHDTGEGGVLRKSVMWTVDAAPPPVVGGGATVVFVEPPVVGLVDRGAVEDVGLGEVDVEGENDVGVVVVVDEEP
jgi:hypothetical protein